MKGLFKLIMITIVALCLFILTRTAVQSQVTLTEAPAGFDNQTNGFLSQTDFDKFKDEFAEIEGSEEGLGPLYNATSCVDCHQNPVTGGVSQVTELRAGRYNGETFTPHPGGSVVHDRATNETIQQRVLATDNVRSFRSSLSILGDGFIEAIADSTLIAISNNQPSGMQGQVVMVPVLEANGALRVGRFGWKDQHASLQSFAADAYVNEMGITSPLQPDEPTFDGASVAAFEDHVQPEDDGTNINAFTQFMRATKVPPRLPSATTLNAVEGARLFRSAGCDICHVPTIVTAPVGTSINGGTFLVPPALGDKVIHPFSDFLLHDVGTGDGIVQNGGPDSQYKLRTPPLWGLRARTRFMHDLQSLSLLQAIRRHGIEAQSVIDYFNSLSATEQAQLMVFLNSL
jgi:CxxC motif-containing protein (DUF1111 family)